MEKLLDKHGKDIELGSVIMWKVWDSDDFVTWTFIGIVRKGHVLYLGGGIDFGSAIGQRISYEEVVEQSDNNDDYDKGILVIGKQQEIPRIIKQELLA